MRRGIRIELEEVSELSHHHKNSSNCRLLVGESDGTALYTAVSCFFLLTVQRFVMHTVSLRLKREVRGCRRTSRFAGVTLHQFFLTTTHLGSRLALSHSEGLHECHFVYVHNKVELMTSKRTDT